MRACDICGQAGISTQHGWVFCARHTDQLWRHVPGGSLLNDVTRAFVREVTGADIGGDDERPDDRNTDGPGHFSAWLQWAWEREGTFPDDPMPDSDDAHGGDVDGGFPEPVNPAPVDLDPNDDDSIPF